MNVSAITLEDNFKINSNTLKKLIHGIKRFIGKEKTEGCQRLLVVLEDGEIKTIKDVGNFNLVPVDDVRTLRRNLRLMARQAAVMSGEDSKDVMMQSLSQLSDAVDSQSL